MKLVESPHRNRIALAAGALVLVPLALHAGDFSVQGANLTVTSGTIRVSFRGPDIAGVTNQITAGNGHTRSSLVLMVGAAPAN